MKQFIGCDVHKKYSVFVSMDESGKAGRAVRVAHGTGELETYLNNLPDGTAVAVETTGHWYWILDAIEKAGLDPHLTHALAAKRMMVNPNKTDKLDARGLATLLRNGTLPEVWVPGRALRDLRGLMRGRLALRRIGTGLKNRISSALARYGLPREFSGDLFGSGEAATKCRQASIAALPEHSRFATEGELDLLESVESCIAEVTKEIAGAELPDGGAEASLRCESTLVEGERRWTSPSICGGVASWWHSAYSAGAVRDLPVAVGEEG